MVPLWHHHGVMDLDRMSRTSTPAGGGRRAAVTMPGRWPSARRPARRRIRLTLQTCWPRRRADHLRAGAGSVELRLRGGPGVRRDTPTGRLPPTTSGPLPSPRRREQMTRINLRLPDHLKTRSSRRRPAKACRSTPAGAGHRRPGADRPGRRRDRRPVQGTQRYTAGALAPARPPNPEPNQPCITAKPKNCHAYVQYSRTISSTLEFGIATCASCRGPTTRRESARAPAKNPTSPPENTRVEYAEAPPGQAAR